MTLGEWLRAFGGMNRPAKSKKWRIERYGSHSQRWVVTIDYHRYIRAYVTNREGHLCPIPLDTGWFVVDDWEATNVR